jgi:hypothetical protein
MNNPKVIKQKRVQIFANFLGSEAIEKFIGRNPVHGIW